MIEVANSLNVKELIFGEARPLRRLYPIVDFSRPVIFADRPLEAVPYIQPSVKEAIIELDDKLLLFEIDRNIPDLKNRGTWQNLLNGIFDEQVAALKLLLVEKAETARNTGSTEISKNDGNDIRKALLTVAKKDGWKNVSGYLRTVADYPDLLVWLQEIIAFQESTLSIPDYSIPGFQPNESENIPVMRRF